MPGIRRTDGGSSPCWRAGMKQGIPPGFHTPLHTQDERKSPAGFALSFLRRRSLRSRLRPASTSSAAYFRALLRTYGTSLRYVCGRRFTWARRAGLIVVQSNASPACRSRELVYAYPSLTLGVRSDPDGAKRGGENVRRWSLSTPCLTQPLCYHRRF